MHLFAVGIFMQLLTEQENSVVGITKYFQAKKCFCREQLVRLMDPENCGSTMLMKARKIVQHKIKYQLKIVLGFIKKENPN